MSARDTIAALASPPGPGERGVVRLSGASVAELLPRLLRDTGGRDLEPPARGAHAARLFDGRGEQPCLLLWMPGPRSYTREDVAELHLPGAPPLLARALARCLELGARSARPGEFTRRAFESGRLDLSRAEGVLSLVEAAGEAERRAALALLEGGLDERVGRLRVELEELRALCEASLDFDESETGHVPREELCERVDAIRAQLDAAARWEQARTPPRGEPRVVLHGAPNAGKSTLFNALVPRAEVLVSPRPGSTRDGVAGTWSLGGVACRLLDAPGLDAKARGVDERAQELAAGERAAADLCLWLVDSRRADLDAMLREAHALPVGTPSLLVWSQLDRPEARPRPTRWAGRPSWVGIAAASGQGLEELASAAASALGLGLDGSEGASGARHGLARELAERHKAGLEGAAEELEHARAGIDQQLALDLVAQHLRLATDELDALEGRTSPEDLLDRIFARFCLGK